MPCTPKVITHQQCGLLINNDSAKKRYEETYASSSALVKIIGAYLTRDESNGVMWRDDQQWKDDLNNGCVIET